MKKDAAGKHGVKLFKLLTGNITKLRNGDTMIYTEIQNQMRTTERVSIKNIWIQKGFGNNRVYTIRIKKKYSSFFRHQTR